MNNNTHEQSDHIKESVLEMIRASEVRMKPRYYFILKVVAVSFVSLLSLTTSAFLFSYIFFSINITHHEFLVGFGERGIAAFLVFFPWRILIIDIVLLLILERLLKQFRFCYRCPLAYLFLAIAALAVFFALMINETPLHQGMLFQAEHKRLPLVGGFYDHLRVPPFQDQGLYRGVIKQVGTSSIQMHLIESNKSTSSLITVYIPLLPTLQEIFKTGDEVFIAGDATGTIINAYGIRKVESEIKP